MIDFKEKAEINKRADQILEDIKSKRLDTFDQFCAVSAIDDLEVAKVIIKRLLEEIQ